MKIVVDVVNSEKVEKLKAEIDRQREAILKWNAAMQTASGTQRASLQLSMEVSAHKIAQATAEIHKLDSASHKLGRGLGQLAYAIDDVQYGFAAIVNNIPQIAMGLGAGAGVAGTLGILAVAINQVAKHWEEFNTIFGNTAPVEYVKGSIIRLQEAFKDTSIGNYVKEFVDRWTKANAEAERHAEILKEIAAALEKIKGIPDKAASERGKVFGEALEKSGGGVAVLQEMTDKAVNAAGNHTPEFRQKMQDYAAQQIARGLAGEDVRTALPKGMRENLDQGQMGAEQARADKLADRANKEQVDALHEKERVDKEDAQERHAWLEDIKRNRIEALQDQREGVLKKQRDFDEDMWQKQHMGGQQSGQIFSGAKAFIDYYAGAGTGGDDPKAIAKAAHEQRRKTNELLEEIDKAVKKERKVIIPN